MVSARLDPPSAPVVHRGRRAHERRRRPRPRTTKPFAASARDHRAVRPCRSRADAARGLSRRPDAACLADRRAAPASARRRSPTGWPASCWPIPIQRRPRCRQRRRLRSMPAHRSVARGSPARRIPTSWCWSAPIEREDGKLRTVITVDDVRRTVSFFGSTAGEGGWRVCIVDAADELQSARRQCAPEGPGGAAARVRSSCWSSHAPGAAAADHPLALPAARSCGRWRRPTSRRPWPPRPTPTAGMPTSDAPRRVAEGSVAARARCCSKARRCDLRERVMGAARRACRRSIRARCTRWATRWRHRAAHTASLRRHRQRMDVGAAARTATQDARRLRRWRRHGTRSTRAARDVEKYNLDRKPLVFAVFGWLAEAARG